MKNKSIQAPIEVVMVIVNKGKGDKVCELLKMNGSFFQIMAYGEGTSQSKSMDFFGFGTIDRDVILGLVNTATSKKILKLLNDNFELNVAHNGIAATIPISSASSEVLNLLGIEY